MARSGVLGLLSYVWNHSDRVLALLDGLLQNLPKIGGALGRAGRTLNALAERLDGRPGAPGARSEVERIRTLLELQEAAYRAAVDDLRSASAALGAVRIPNLRMADVQVSLPRPLGSVSIPMLRPDGDDRSPLEGIAAVLDRQVAQLDALSAPLRSAAEGLENLGGLLGTAVSDLAAVGRVLEESGSALEKVAAEPAAVAESAPAPQPA